MAKLLLITTLLLAGPGCKSLTPLSVFGIEGLSIELIHIERQVHEHRHYTQPQKEVNQNETEHPGNPTDPDHADRLPAGNPFARD